MNLEQISKVLSGLDSMYEKTHDLKESIMDNLDNIEQKKTSFDREAREMIDTLVAAIYSRKSDVKEKQEYYMFKLRELVCNVGGIETEQLIKSVRTRKREYVKLRQVHQAFLHKTFNLSMPKTGAIYSQDHATVHHACKTVRNLYQTDKDFRKEFQEVIDFCMNYDKLFNQNNTIEYLTEK